MKSHFLTFTSKRAARSDTEFEMSSIPSAQNLFALNGLIAVVTGGGSGIGLMIAKAIAANGASSVYILGLPDDSLEEIAKQAVRYESFRSQL